VELICPQLARVCNYLISVTLTHQTLKRVPFTGVCGYCRFQSCVNAVDIFVIVACVWHLLGVIFFSFQAAVFSRRNVASNKHLCDLQSDILYFTAVLTVPSFVSLETYVRDSWAAPVAFFNFIHRQKNTAYLANAVYEYLYKCISLRKISDVKFLSFIHILILLSECVGFNVTLDT